MTGILQAPDNAGPIKARSLIEAAHRVWRMNRRLDNAVGDLHVVGFSKAHAGDPKQHCRKKTRAGKPLAIR